MGKKKEEAKSIPTLAELGLTRAVRKAYDVAPSRITELNSLLPGGFVYGKWNLVYGMPSAGKTTTTIQAIADAQAKDPEHHCVLVPAEKGEDLAYYENMGLDLSRTYIVDLDQYFIEDVFEKLENILKNSKELNIKSVVIDSWDGMLSHKQLYDAKGNRKAITQETVAVKAAAAARLIPIVKGYTGSKNILFMIICQVRTGGIGGYMTFEKFAGGNALEHNTDIAVYMGINGSIKEKVDDHDVQVGNEIKIVLKKTKVNANAHKGVVVPFIFESGWDSFRAIWVQAQEKGIVQKLGGGYFQCDLFPEEGKKKERKIRGEKLAIEFFKSDPKMVDQLTQLISTTPDKDESTEQSTEEANIV